ncbi:MAG: putative porin [Candidatus Omnitrophica bacterium]|nr:putative porin [Candidatus Omnitrophota bacterium]
MRIVPVAGWFLAAQLVLATLSFAAETDVDRLLEFLIKERVITQEKATEFRADLAIKKQDEKQPSAVPDWVSRTKLKGDFRLRYEWDQNKGQSDYNRARIMARLGLETKVNEKVKLGIGIATGSSSDPRTSYVTLGTNVGQTNTPDSAKNVVLNYAYGEYTPFKELRLIGGKFQDVIWRPSDVFWDTDINPEGAGFNFDYKLNSKVGLFWNELFNVLRNDDRTSKQVFMSVTQPGVNIAVNDEINLKSALAVNVFSNIKGAAKFSNSSGTNSLTAGNQYKYNYNSFQPSLELSFKEPFGGLVPYGALFGDYVYNFSLPDSATGRGGYDFGLKFGKAKVENWKDWQAKIIYSKVGRDAWLDIFPDSSRYSGKTNDQVVETQFDFGLGKNTSLTLDYYYGWNLIKSNSASNAPAQVLQVDWNVKF